MKKNFLSAVMFGMMVLTTACSNEDDSVFTRKEVNASVSSSTSTGTVAGTKTVLIYMAGRNDLSGALMSDLYEVKQGSKRLQPNENLVVFVRNTQDEQPWVARINNGAVTDSVSLSDLGIRSSDGDNRASDPAVMEGVMRYAFSHYPAINGNYGLVIEGHGTGWLMNNEVKYSKSRAALVDWGVANNKYDGRWINVPHLATILKDLPHLKFIMTDCCNMMCLENLYELRNVCDYMIGSPAEIPDHGAPYDQIVPDMFADGKFYNSIIDKYFNSVRGTLPLVAVKSSEMVNVAQATRTAMQAVRSKLSAGQSKDEKTISNYPNMKGIIHYYHMDDSGSEFRPEYNIFYDAGDFMRTFAPADAYQQWRQALDLAIVKRCMAKKWATDKRWEWKYSDFTVTEEKFHGVSMFVPQDPSRGNYAKYNEDIKQMEWYAATN